MSGPVEVISLYAVRNARHHTGKRNAGMQKRNKSYITETRAYIISVIERGGLVKSGKERNALNLLEIINNGFIPKRLPCENPCERADNSGGEYLFSCETCLRGMPNLNYYSSYHKKIINESLRWKVWENDNFTCRKCRSRVRLTVDHIIPECKGGETIETNLQTLCKPCNSKKASNG